MKTLILAVLSAVVLASALSVQAADRPVRFDGAKFFEDIAKRAGQ